MTLCVFVYYAHIPFLRETKCADFVNKQVFRLHIEINIEITIDMRFKQQCFTRFLFGMCKIAMFYYYFLSSDFKPNILAVNIS